MNWGHQWEAGVHPALRYALSVFSHPPHLVVPSARVGNFPALLMTLRKQTVEAGQAQVCVGSSPRFPHTADSSSTVQVTSDDKPIP